MNLNQPLTSDAIHEDVRDDMSPYGEALCLDQFDVEPLSSYRGGYLDNIVSGKMGVPFVASEGYMSGSQGDLSINDRLLAESPVNRSARQVVASMVDGQAGITGSLERFVTVVDSSETFYDSTVPGLFGIVTSYGVKFDEASAPPYVVLGARPFNMTNLGANEGSNKWGCINSI